jgi:hypothetical protein
MSLHETKIQIKSDSQDVQQSFIVMLFVNKTENAFFCIVAVHFPDSHIVIIAATTTTTAAATKYKVLDPPSRPGTMLGRVPIRQFSNELHYSTSNQQ